MIRAKPNLIELIKKADDKRQKETQLSVEEYLEPYKNKEWYKHAVNRTVELTERINRFFSNSYKKLTKILSLEEGKNLYKDTKFDYDGVKDYKTREYLDYMYNRVVVDDIKDSLVLYYQEYEKNLEDIFGKSTLGLAEDMFKLEDALPFNFNKPSKLVSEYLKTKKINWGKEVMLTTEYTVKQCLVKGYENGTGVAGVTKLLKENTIFSYRRAELVARTEINMAAQYIQYQDYLSNSNVVGITWSSKSDARTRPTHKKANGQYRKKGEPFIVGGYKLLHPLDGSFGAPAKEIVQCRCGINPVFKGEEEQYSKDKTIYDDKDIGSKEWLLRQDDDFQLEYVGSKKRLEYIKDGSIDIKDFNIPLKELRNSGKIKLNNNEMYAINRYISSGAYILNEKLRNNDKLSDDDKKFINDLVSALSKMPDYNGDLKRSVYFGNETVLNEFLVEYSIGDDKEFKEFISTTKGEVHNPRAEVQIIIKNSKKGKDISKYNEQELEVLYKRNMKFKIIDLYKINDITYIELREI